MQPLIDLDWRDVVGYEGLYQVSSCGLVRSVDREVLYKPSKPASEGKAVLHKGRVLKGWIMCRGYVQVQLYKGKVRKGKLVHRLVAEAFIENPQDLPEVNHKDLVKTNNAVHNLEWCTSSQNSLHFLKEVKCNAL